MNRLKRLPVALAASLLLLSLTGISQKIVYKNPFTIRNNMFSKKLMSSWILFDSVSGQKLLMVSGIKNLHFYVIDKNWKTVKQFDHAFVKGSNLSSDGFKVNHFSKKGDNWTFASSGGFFNFALENVDAAAGNLVVKQKMLEDIDKQFVETNFRDEGKNYTMYLSKEDNSSIQLASYNDDLKIQTVRLRTESQLPLKKSKKFMAKEQYEYMQQMDSIMSSSFFFTRRKVHLYSFPGKFAISVVNEEPVAELTYYDKQTGRKLRSDLFSLESLVPEKDRNSCNASFLLYDNKAWVLAAYKTGGVLGVFDLETKKLLYNFQYDSKTNPSAFNYAPVMYETAPGNFNITGGAKEKITDLRMEKFCKELYGHSSGIAIKPFKDGYIVMLGNYDMKDLIAPTSGMRSTPNRMSSPLFFVSSSAGLLFKKDALVQSEQKTTINEVYNDDVSKKYAKVFDKSLLVDNEYDDSKAFIMGHQMEGSTLYIVYYFDGQVKIAERKSN